MKKPIIRLSIPLLVLWFSSLVAVAEQLTLDQLLTGLRSASQGISSGEVKILYLKIRAPENTPEQAQRWLVNVKKDAEASLKKENSYNITNYHTYVHNLTRMSSTYESIATLKTLPKIDRHEFDTAFEVYADQKYRYRSTIFDRSLVNPDRLATQQFSVSWQRVVTFDGSMQLVEKELQNGAQSTSIYSSNRLFSFIPCYSFGRILITEQDIEQTEFVGIDESEGKKQYMLKISTPQMEKTETRIWVDTEMYMVTRQERHVNDHLMHLTEFKNFAYLKDSQVWYPFYARSKLFNSEDELIREDHYLTIDAQFNVNFPPDFFEIDLSAIKGSDIRITPYSDINSQPQTEKKKVQTKPVNETASTNVQCGPQSLLRVCEIFKKETTLAELCKLSNLDLQKGTSLLGLHKAAKELGLNPKGVHVQ